MTEHPVPAGSDRPAAAHSISASTEDLLDSAPDGVVIIDASGAIRLVNRQAEVLFGYQRDELLGQLLEILIPDSIRARHPRHRAAYFENPMTRPMGAGIELSARRKDGTEFPVDISLSWLETKDGMIVLASVRDITDRLRIEEERARLEAQLRQAQRDEERAVLEARLHQAQRLESVGQLAGGIAHDFNNLLGGIMNYAGLVAMSLDDQLTRLGLENDAAFATIRQDIAEITTVARRAAALTHQLLIFSRREVVKPEVLDLNTVVIDLEKLLRRTIGEDIDLRTSLQPMLTHLRADRGQIEQVIMNLAVNARDAMPSGGRLEISTSEFEVEAEPGATPALPPGRYVRLTVSDTGVGMTPQVAARAFEPFFTTKPKGAGTGLGLATVYGIATQAGGDVAVYSEPGLGTTMRVDFPATTDQTAPMLEANADFLLGAKGETVLLVEDEEMVREPARRMLVRHGYTVLAAADSDQALAVARDHAGPIHLLLTDVIMPRRSGKELADDVVALRPDTRILFMSGYSHDVIVHQGALDPGVHLIEKPFAVEALLHAVRNTLDTAPSKVSAP